mgnify:CR=1 FL=1
MNTDTIRAAIDAGITLEGRTGDYAGNPILATPDIGALENSYLSRK